MGFILRAPRELRILKRWSSRALLNLFANPVVTTIAIISGVLSVQIYQIHVRPFLTEISSRREIYNLAEQYQPGRGCVLYPYLSTIIFTGGTLCFGIIVFNFLWHFIVLSNSRSALRMPLKVERELNELEKTLAFANSYINQVDSKIAESTDSKSRRVANLCSKTRMVLLSADKRMEQIRSVVKAKGIVAFPETKRLYEEPLEFDFDSFGVLIDGTQHDFIPYVPMNRVGEVLEHLLKRIHSLLDREARETLKGI